MIDFKKKDLYKREQTRMKNFLDNKLVTNTENQELEYNASINADGTGLLEAGDFLEGDAFEIGDDGDGLEGFGDLDDGLGGFGDAGDRSGVKDATDWKYEGNPIKTFFFAPLHLLRYVFLDLTEDFPSKEEWKDILKVLNTINVFTIITAVIAMLMGIKTIFSPKFQLIAGVVMFVITTITIKFVYKEDTKFIQFIKKVFLGKEYEENDLDFEGMDSLEDDLLEEGEFLEDGDVDFGYGALDEDTSEMMFESIDEGSEEVIEEGDIEGSGLEESKISTETNEVFKEGLLRSFAKNSRYTGHVIQDRLGLLNSFSDYLIQNSPNFKKWVRPKERGIEYSNIAYSLFKGLSQIETQFSKYENEDKMVVLDVKKTPLLYRIDVELPQYFKERKLQRNIKVIEDVLRKSEDDTDVTVIISTFQGNFVFKLLRFDSKELVSLGDVLRFKDEDEGYVGLKAFNDVSKGLPVLLGLQNNENPYVVDLENNTSGVIVGGSGSGKSWATFLIMLNITLTNDYNNVHFIVMDAKNSSFWNSFAKFPHVLGFHTDIYEYIDILREVNAVREERQEFLNKISAEDFKGYRESLREEGDYEKLKEAPLLFVIIDEIYYVMSTFKREDEDLFKEFTGLLTEISSTGRSAGVRLISIGQRSTYDSIPKGVMATSSFKLGMRMDVEQDYNTLFGDIVKDYNTPESIGMGLVQTQGVSTLQTVKTVTIGGKNNSQMIMLIRVLAFEWMRRSYGIDDVENMPDIYKFKKSYNRDKFYRENIQEMKEGRITSISNVDEGYEVVFEENLKDKKPGYKIEQEQKVIEEQENEKDKKDSEVLNIVDGLTNLGRGQEDDIDYKIDEIDDDDFEQIIENEFTSNESEQDEEEHLNLSDGEDDLSWESLKDELFEEIGVVGDNNKLDTEDNIEREKDNNFKKYKTEQINNNNLDEKEEHTESGQIKKEGIDEYTNTEIKNNIDSGNNYKQQDSVEKDKQNIPELEDVLRADENEGEYFGEIYNNKNETDGEYYGESIDDVRKKSKKEVKNDVKGLENNTGNNSQEVHQNVENQAVPLMSILEEEKLSELDDENDKELIIEEQRKEIEKLKQIHKEVLNKISENEYKQKGNKTENNESEIIEDKNNEENIIEQEDGGFESDKYSSLKGVQNNDSVKGQGKENNKEVELGFVTDSDTDKEFKEEPDIPIKAYIAKYGTTRGLNVYMRKEDIDNLYNEDKVKEALDRLIMIESDGHYVIRM